MKLLAIETSSDACSVAIQIDEQIFENHVVEPRAHTRILLPMIRGLLDQVSLDAVDLDALVLGNGPGSFIGMRIGASVAQGICHGAQLNIVPVSSLATVAAEVMHLLDAERVVVAQDARMNEVYIGQYGRNRHGVPEAICEEQICAIGPVPEIERDSVAAGQAWQKYDELKSANSHAIREISEVTVPRARFLLASGQRDYENGKAIAPEALLPAYIRTKVAEVPRATG